MLALMQVVASRVLGIRLSDLGRAVAPSVAVAAGTAAGAGAIRVLLPGPEPVRLALAIVAGAAGALVVAWTVDRGTVRRLKETIASGPNVSSAHPPLGRERRDAPKVSA